MLLAEFNFEGTPLVFWRAPNGKPVVTAASLVMALKGDRNNAAAITRNNVRPEWLIELPTPSGGRPSICLFEPGAYQLASNVMFQTDLAVRLQKFMFEVALPKLLRTNVRNNNVSAEKALSLVLPNTDPYTLAALAKRDKDINRVRTLTEIHNVLPYSFPRHKTKEWAVLDACSKALIYGHDYWYSKRDACWVMTYVGTEYLVNYSRPEEPINLNAFGNTHTVTNLARFLTNEGFPKLRNGYAPRVKMEASQLMANLLTKDWYPISYEGLRYFTLAWNGDNLMVWNEFRQLCSTLDTGRYTRFVRSDKRFDMSYNITALQDRGWKILRHPHSNDLWTLVTDPCHRKTISLASPSVTHNRPTISPAKPLPSTSIEYRTHKLPRSLQGSDEINSTII